MDNTIKMTKETTDVAVKNEAGEVMDTKELAGKLGDMEEGVKLTGSYFNPEMGEEVKCFFIGNTEINAIEGSGKVVAVRLLLEDESTAITASTMIVGACAGLSIPTAIVIVKKEERKLDKGKILNVFEVATLQLKA